MASVIPKPSLDVEEITAALVEHGGEKSVIQPLVAEFRRTFAKDDTELGLTNLVEHKIDTGESKPIKLPAYKTTPVKLVEIKRQVQQMLDLDIIQPSKSDWSAPVVLVGKKDGSSRFCVDFRKLNSVTKKDAFPLPLIDQILDCLEGAKVFTSLDLAAGYWQVPLDGDSIPKTAFSTPDGGHYEYKRLPFGLCNAPATFQRLMNELFKEELYKFVTIFLDDVLIYSSDEKEHADHLRLVLKKLEEAGLKLKPSKCRMGCSEVSYLGYHIGADGIWPDEGKIKALSNWPEPTNVTEVRSFVGFCSYYRRFVQDFAGVAKPLHELTKKNQRFNWDENCRSAFEELKRKLIGAPILSHPNYEFPFILDTDASHNSIAAVLSNLDQRQECPVAFSSRVLSRTEVNYSTTKREALAVVQAVKWFRSYLLGVPFILRTDHASLQWLFRQNADGMTFRMIETLQEFDFQVVHRPGNKHGNADALSRQTTQTPEWTEEETAAQATCPESLDLETALSNLRKPVFVTNEHITMDFRIEEEDLIARQKQDVAINFILSLAKIPTNEPRCTRSSLGINPITKDQAQKNGPEALNLWSLWDQLEIQNGILMRRWWVTGTNETRWLVVIPRDSRNEILEHLHDSKVTGGHFAFAKTLDRIRQRFWWPHMRKDVDLWIKGCKECAARSTAGRKRIGDLQPIVVGIRFAKVAADILGPITRVRETGNKYILVLTDYFTKYVVTVPLSTITAADVAKAFVEKWVLRFGAPDTLHTDQGTNFCSDLMTEVCNLLHVERTRTSPYHPQGNGQVERHNRVLADVLSKYCSENPRDWESILPYVEFVYNTTIHRSTGKTPFCLVFGEEATYPIDLMYPKPPGNQLLVHEFTQLLDEKFREAHMNARNTLGSSQKRQKDQYFKKTHGSPYKPDDLVWLFSPQLARSRKFFLPWTGPYKVIRKISEVNYEISSEKNRKKTQIVHYNRLKPYRVRDSTPPRLTRQRQPQAADGDLSSGEEDDDQLLHQNRNVHRRRRQPMYDMWGDEDLGDDLQGIFNDPHYWNIPLPRPIEENQDPVEPLPGDEEIANIENETHESNGEETEEDTNHEQPIANDSPPPQRRYPDRNRRPVDRMGL